MATDASTESAFEQAIRRYQEGDEPAELIPEFQAITDAAPRLAAGWTCLAWLQLLDDQPVAALRSARMAVKLNPQDPQSRVNLSVAMLETGAKGVREHIDMVLEGHGRGARAGQRAAGIDRRWPPAAARLGSAGEGEGLAEGVNGTVSPPATATKRILLISNGHGEDLSGSLIGQELLASGAEVAALPLVGHGHAYQQAGVPVLGRTRTYSTGGLGYTSLAGRLTELFQGQVTYVIRRLVLFLTQSRRFDLVVVIGDVLPVLAAWLSCRPVVTYLVAYSSHYEGRLRLPWPCGWCLRNARFQRVYSRDSLTATDLTAQLGRPVHFLGNPFLDRALEPAAPLQPLEPRLSTGARLLGLLPGSRLPEALRNLELMLKVLVRLPPSWQQRQRLELVAALVKDLQRELVAQCAAPLGWTLQGDRLERGPLVLHLVWGASRRWCSRATCCSP